MSVIRDLITPREKVLEAKMKRMANELDLPFIQAFFEVGVYDGRGDLLDGIRSRSHSWTRNGYNLAFSTMAQKNASDGTFDAGKVSAKTTAGVVQSGNYGFRSHDSNLDGGTVGFRALAGVDAFGIVIGTLGAAENFEDYMLGAKISNGVGAGQMSYADGEAHAISYSPPTLKNTLVRYFNNNSGASIGVNEIGIIGKLGRPDSTGYADYLVARDLLASTVTVPDTGQLKVTYEISLTYPS